MMKLAIVFTAVVAIIPVQVGSVIECVIPVVKWWVSKKMNRHRKVMLPDNDLRVRQLLIH